MRCELGWCWGSSWWCSRCRRVSPARRDRAGGELTGDGLAAPIALSGGEGTGAGDGLIMQTGFFAATFREVPDPMLDARPAGELGPKLTITWQLRPAPGADALNQDIYPYADGGPLTYMAPGQRFYTTERTRGGWYRSSPALLTTLQQLGVPSQAVLIANAPVRTPPARPAPVDAAHTHARAVAADRCDPGDRGCRGHFVDLLPQAPNHRAEHRLSTATIGGGPSTRRTCAAPTSAGRRSRRVRSAAARPRDRGTRAARGCCAARTATTRPRRRS